MLPNDNRIGITKILGFQRLIAFSRQVITWTVDDLMPDGLLGKTYMKFESRYIFL